MTIYASCYPLFWRAKKKALKLEIGRTCLLVINDFLLRGTGLKRKDYN